MSSEWLNIHVWRFKHEENLLLFSKQIKFKYLPVYIVVRSVYDKSLKLAIMLKNNEVDSTSYLTIFVTIHMWSYNYLVYVSISSLLF